MQKFVAVLVRILHNIFFTDYLYLVERPVRIIVVVNVDFYVRMQNVLAGPAEKTAVKLGIFAVFVFICH